MGFDKVFLSINSFRMQFINDCLTVAIIHHKFTMCSQKIHNAQQTQCNQCVALAWQANRQLRMISSVIVVLYNNILEKHNMPKTITTILLHPASDSTANFVK